MLESVINNHEASDLDCPSCEEQFGSCSCGGVIHCEYQETFRRQAVKQEDGKTRWLMVPNALLVLECDNCDNVETQ